MDKWCGRRGEGWKVSSGYVVCALIVREHQDSCREKARNPLTSCFTTFGQTPIFERSETVFPKASTQSTFFPSTLPPAMLASSLLLMQSPESEISHLAAPAKVARQTPQQWRQKASLAGVPASPSDAGKSSTGYTQRATEGRWPPHSWC